MSWLSVLHVVVFLASVYSAAAQKAIQATPIATNIPLAGYNFLPGITSDHIAPSVTQFIYNKNASDAYLFTSLAIEATALLYNDTENIYDVSMGANFKQYVNPANSIAAELPFNVFPSATITRDAEARPSTDVCTSPLAPYNIFLCYFGEIGTPVGEPTIYCSVFFNNGNHEHWSPTVIEIYAHHNQVVNDNLKVACFESGAYAVFWEADNAFKYSVVDAQGAVVDGQSANTFYTVREHNGEVLQFNGIAVSPFVGFADMDRDVGGKAAAVPVSSFVLTYNYQVLTEHSIRGLIGVLNADNSVALQSTAGPTVLNTVAGHNTTKKELVFNAGSDARPVFAPLLSSGECCYVIPYSYHKYNEPYAYAYFMNFVSAKDLSYALLNQEPYLVSNGLGRNTIALPLSFPLPLPFYLGAVWSVSALSKNLDYQIQFLSISSTTTNVGDGDGDGDGYSVAITKLNNIPAFIMDNDPNRVSPPVLDFVLFPGNILANVMYSYSYYGSESGVDDAPAKFVARSWKLQLK